MMREGALPPDTQRRGLESLVRNAKAQAQLVEDLLDVSRVMPGKLEVKADAVDVAHVVTGALDTSRPTAAAKRVTIHSTIDADTQILVTGDADRLQQIVWNLLANAVKFTPAGGAVDVELRQMDSNVEIVVKDTGQGIARDFMPHVFERFRQADSTVSRQHGGLGLGLAIVRHLTEAHGGTVSAESPGNDQGATFRVRLPIRAVARRVEEEAQSVAGGTGTNLTGTRVLVVDDEPDARDLIRVALEVRGAQVTTAGSAGAALHLLTQQRFHVLLADIGMPEQDGYSLVQALRALPPHQGGQMPAVAVTAYASLRGKSVV